MEACFVEAHFAAGGFAAACFEEVYCEEASVVGFVAEACFLALLLPELLLALQWLLLHF